jgi:replicative DNA helicase
MSSEQLVTRILAQECGIPSERIRRGEIKEEDFSKIVEANKKLAELPFYIDDTPALTISAVRTRARRLKRQFGIDLIVIDYLQLLQGSSDKRNDNRVQEISEITRSLKALAKELDVPVIALSQLSRAVEARDDKRPQLADLRESGTIEQDADVVMFVYREEYYEARREPSISDGVKHAEWLDRMSKIYNLAEVIFAKQRHGPIGTVRLFFDGRYTKFTDLSEGRKSEHEE